MEVRRLGVEGPELSVIGLGCNMFGWTIDADRSRAVVEAALDCGITHFDTAEMYAGRGFPRSISGERWVYGGRRRSSGTSFATAWKENRSSPVLRRSGFGRRASPAYGGWVQIGSICTTTCTYLIQLYRLRRRSRPFKR